MDFVHQSIPLLPGYIVDPIDFSSNKGKKIINETFEKKNYFLSTLFLERFNINLKSVRFQLGIDKKIVDNLMKWNIKKLLEDEYDEWSDLEKGISIISDGTILWLKYT